MSYKYPHRLLFTALAVVPASSQVKSSRSLAAPSAEAPPAAEAPGGKREVHIVHDESNSVRPVEWGYHGRLGPEFWGELSPAYEACAVGASQSPVNLPIDQAAPAERVHELLYEMSGLTVAHHAHVHDILDNGHTIQVNIDEGSVLKTARDTYHLRQFHFHSPSENLINGQRYPLEVHFVHQSDAGHIAVISSLYEVGKHNEELDHIIANLPSEQGKEHVPEDGSIDPDMHLPQNHAAYHFIGSLTTPPCTEGVEWIIFKETDAATLAQLEIFEQKLNHNSRPVQAWNDRMLKVSSLEDFE